MSRARAADKSDSVSLFPFLAVLLCTMGALLVLLVGMAKSARDRAEQSAELPAEPDPSVQQATHRVEQMRDYAQRLERLQAEAEIRLQQEKARLSHLDDHIRRLVDELDGLKAAAVELNALDKQHVDDPVQAQRELDRLKALVSETEREIEETKQAQKGKHKSYSIVPYKGPNGTTRPPIYIECRRDKVIIQPEGIELLPTDFEPPLGPGNPLAAALRAASEFTLAESRDRRAAGEQEIYPLILVRPDGIGAYYRVREAIASWDADFGYELIDGQWELKFPLPNPQLANAEFLAVKLSRERRKLLARAAPTAYSGAPPATFDVVVDDSERDVAASGSGLPWGSGSGAGSGALPGGDEQGLAQVHGGTGEDVETQLSSFGGREEGLANARSQLSGSGRGPGGPHDVDGSDSSPTGQFADTPPEGTAKTPRPAGSPSMGVVAGNVPGSADSGSAGSTAGASGRSGAGSTSSGTSGTGTAAASKGSVASHSDAAQPSSSFSSGPGSPGQVVRRSSSNWALPETSAHSVPIRRHVNVFVSRDSLVILPDRHRMAGAVGKVQGRVIAWSDQREEMIGPFVSSLQEHMQDWGMAGNGLYWKPVLLLNVGPGASDRADELTRLLQHSGVDVQLSETVQRPIRGASDEKR